MPNTQPTSPEPPEGCICASFWTVRRQHKKDCPLAVTSPSREELRKQILTQGLVKSTVVRWTKNTDEPIKMANQHVVEIPIDDLMSLIDAREAGIRAEAEQHGEITGKFLAGSELLLELGPLMVHTTQEGFPSMSSEMIHKANQRTIEWRKDFQAMRAQELLNKQGEKDGKTN